MKWLNYRMVGCLFQSQKEQQSTLNSTNLLCAGTASIVIRKISSVTTIGTHIVHFRLMMTSGVLMGRSINDKSELEENWHERIEH